jgi:hypothetical protein
MDREDYDFYDYSDFEEPEWQEEWPRDKKIDEAKEELTAFFKGNNEDVYYMKQLEVFFEKKYFHWITAKAVNEMIEEGFLGKEQVPLQAGTSVKFVFNKSLRYYRRLIHRHIKVIRDYANPNIAIACGRQAEVLFLHALVNNGFLSHGQDLNEYGDRKWEETEHNLDFIIERDDTVYGCEIKNKWDYIEKDELDIKLKICEVLKLRPLFIMRASPKTYNWQIARMGGYAMIFEAQIYPFGQKILVERIKKDLGLPVDSPRAIPDGIIKRFMRWHDSHKRT